MADVNGELTDIYKVFSERVLTSEQISKLFKKVHEINEVDWLAYPKYDLSLNLSKIQFKLGVAEETINKNIKFWLFLCFPFFNDEKIET